MRRIITYSLFLVVLFVSHSFAENFPVQKFDQSASWTLVWEDEFNAPELDSSKWVCETGGHGWGNNEKQFYTNRPENVRIENGSLIIEARKEEYNNSAYTSARLKTLGKKSFKYGRIEARIILPKGKGVWPAFWMLGDDIQKEGVGWPNCGEIDIMEYLGHEPCRVYGTVHGPEYSGAKGISSQFNLASGEFCDGPHDFSIEWDENQIQWYVDGTHYKTVTKDMVPGKWVFDHPHFILLNVAIGGNWPGEPDKTTVFPQKMQVEYVRVYQKK
ncbi:MAG: glycoside hydrolase family 16 protein [Candidatus Riflebacteria bacterium]|nr:glycoside hydrolase family 16 protein [Candidatus Riflebacteria bacterium]